MRAAGQRGTSRDSQAVRKDRVKRDPELVYEEYLRVKRMATRLQFNGFGPELQIVAQHLDHARWLLIELLEIFEDELDAERDLTETETLPWDTMPSC